jgi:hypothetical protein
LPTLYIVTKVKSRPGPKNGFSSIDELINIVNLIVQTDLLLIKGRDYCIFPVIKATTCGQVHNTPEASQCQNITNYASIVIVIYSDISCDLFSLLLNSLSWAMAILYEILLATFLHSFK